MKKIISIIIVSIAALIIIFFGFIMVKYATIEPFDLTEFIIYIVLFGFMILTIWAIDNLRKK
jgi:hypothetical protein